VSSFLVTDGQFPVQLESIERITQRYFSVAVFIKNKLFKVEPPLSKDEFERLGRPLDILRLKRDKRITLCRLILLNIGTMSDSGSSPKAAAPAQNHERVLVGIATHLAQLNQSMMALTHKVDTFSKQMSSVSKKIDELEVDQKSRADADKLRSAKRKSNQKYAGSKKRAIGNRFVKVVNHVIMAKLHMM